MHTISYLDVVGTEWDSYVQGFFQSANSFLASWPFKLWRGIPLISLKDHLQRDLVHMSKNRHQESPIFLFQVERKCAKCHLFFSPDWEFTPTCMTLFSVANIHCWYKGVCMYSLTPTGCWSLDLKLCFTFLKVAFFLSTLMFLPMSFKTTYIF